MGFIQSLESAFKENSNFDNAQAMSKYMRNLFPFFGIKTEERRRIFKSVYKKNQKEITKNARSIATELYSKSEREFHYCAIEILIKELKGKYEKADIYLIEKLISTNSWWDTVDTISKFILGDYLKEFPLEIEKCISNFTHSDNLWLNRSLLLFQLGYKQKTNEALLFSECLKRADSGEFFIQKAIGWALREYAKTNPEAVRNFVSQHQLKPLSSKEALKNLS